jgi:hypothetical protein
MFCVVHLQSIGDAFENINPLLLKSGIELANLIKQRKVSTCRMLYFALHPTAPHLHSSLNPENPAPQLIPLLCSSRLSSPDHQRRARGVVHRPDRTGQLSPQCSGDQTVGIRHFARYFFVCFSLLLLLLPPNSVMTRLAPRPERPTHASPPLPPTACCSCPCTSVYRAL